MLIIVSSLVVSSNKICDNFANNYIHYTLFDKDYP